MKKLISWLGVVLTVTIIFGAIYITVQQDLRVNADAPQAQVAEKTADKLDHHASPHSLTKNEKVNIDSSTKQFTIIYNKSGQPVAGNGYVDGKLPKVSHDVLATTKAAKTSKATVEPAPDVPVAAVTAKANDYYVLTGHAVKQVQGSEYIALAAAVVGWMAVVAIISAKFWKTGSYQ